MFIDYLTLMLLNMIVGLVIIAVFMWSLAEKNSKKLVLGFLLTGFIGLVTGLHMTFTWPLPAAYNIPFGELTVFLGALLLMTGISLIFGWDLIGIGIYAFFVGVTTVILSIRFLTLKLTSDPLGTAMLTLPALAWPKQKWLRWPVALGGLASAVMWAIVAFPSYGKHMEDFARWAPGGGSK